MRPVARVINDQEAYARKSTEAVSVKRYKVVRVRRIANADTTLGPTGSVILLEEFKIGITNPEKLRNRCKIDNRGQEPKRQKS
jgi:hypothetical protein